jgi:prepilin-type N-terminal cleavage/methylation domain-containing protein
MTPRRDSPLGTDGFTLIEVLVALVILSAGLLVFYEFLSGALDAAGRVRHAAEAYDRDQNALALAATLNPMATPEGMLDLGTYRIRWRAERIGTERQSAEFPLGDKGHFTVALYRVVLDFPDDREFAPVQVTKFGYHRETVPGEPSDDTVN